MRRDELNDELDVVESADADDATTDELEEEDELDEDDDLDEEIETDIRRAWGEL